jgi:hypothetical protein
VGPFVAVVLSAFRFRSMRYEKKSSLITDFDQTVIPFPLLFCRQNGVSVGVNYKELEKLPSKHRFTPRARLKVEVTELEPFADHVAIFFPILDLQSTLLSESSQARRPRLPSRTWSKVCSSSSQSLPNYFMQSGSPRPTTDLISLHPLLPYLYPALILQPKSPTLTRKTNLNRTPSVLPAKSGNLQVGNLPSTLLGANTRKRTR